MRVQFPTMIYKLSLDNVGVTRNFLVDNEKHCLHPHSRTYKQLMTFYDNFDHDIDERQLIDDNQVTYMNTLEYQGSMITDKRILQYENGILGITNLKFQNRHEFVQQVQSLCKVNYIKNAEGDTLFRGSCFNFVKDGYCDHSASCKYRQKIIINSEPIPKKRLSKSRKFKPSSAADSLREKYKDLLKLTNFVGISFTEAKDISYELTGIDSDLSLVIRDSPKLLVFFKNLRDNKAQSRNKEKVLRLLSMMKRITCHVENLLDETRLLEHDTSANQF